MYQMYLVFPFEEFAKIRSQTLNQLQIWWHAIPAKFLQAVPTHQLYFIFLVQVQAYRIVNFKLAAQQPSTISLRRLKMPGYWLVLFCNFPQRSSGFLSTT